MEEGMEISKEQEKESARQTLDDIFEAALELVDGGTRVDIPLGIDKGKLKISEIRNQSGDSKRDAVRIQLMRKDGSITNDLWIRREAGKDWSLEYADYSGETGQRIEWRKSKGKTEIDLEEAMKVVPEIVAVKKVVRDTAFS